MQSFNYVAVRSVDEVVALLSQYGDQARVLAGGTDILVQMRTGRLDVKLIVDIKPISEINELVYTPIEGLQLGAAVPCFGSTDFASIGTVRIVAKLFLWVHRLFPPFCLGPEKVCR